MKNPDLYFPSIKGPGGLDSVKGSGNSVHSGTVSGDWRSGGRHAQQRIVHGKGLVEDKVFFDFLTRLLGQA